MDLHESVRRIHECEDVFGRRFYETFLREYPEARNYFAQTNMDRQAVVFTMQLMVIEAFHQDGTPTAAEYLRVLGTWHHERGIPLDLYQGFRDCLLRELEQFHGADWDAPLAGQWSEALDGAIQQMAEGYAQRYHV